MRICKNCKNECKDAALFCAFCGERLEQQPDITNEAAVEQEPTARYESEPLQELTAEEAPAPEKEKPAINTKLLAIGAACVTAILVILLFIVLAPRGDMLLSEAHQWNFFDNDDGDLVIACDGKIVCELNDSYDDYAIGKECKYVFVLLEDGDLFKVTPKGEKLIDSDVHSFAVCSTDDDLAYFKEYDKYDETGELYYWNGSKAKLIDEEVDAIFSVSPDTKTIIYHKEIEILSQDFETYISKNGKTGKLMEDQERIVLALSNNAKTRIEYMPATFDTNMYIVKGDKEYEMGYSGEIGGIYVNTSMSEVLFVCDESLYLSVNGKEPEEIYDDIEDIRLCIPEKKQLNSYGTNKVLVVKTDSFCNIPIIAQRSSVSSDIISVNKKLEVKIYAEDVSDVVLTEDEKTFFFIDDDYNLCSMKNKKSASVKEIASDVESYTVTPDGKYCAYLTDDSELYYYKGGKDKSVEDDVGYYKMTDNGNLYYYYEDSDEMMLMKKNGDTDEIENSDEFDYLIVCNDSCYVLDEDNVLSLLTGSKLKELCEDIYMG